MMIKNIPAYAADYEYIVYRICEGCRWFYGAYHLRSEAMKVAQEIGGYWLPMLF